VSPASPPAASPWLTAGFGLFAPALIALGVAGVAWAERRLGAPPAQVRRRAAAVAAGGVAWLAATWGLAASGVLARFDPRPPPLLGLLAAVLAVAAAVAASRPGTRLVRGLPLPALVGAQGFRLPLELLMHRAADEGVMPVQMSYSGWNLDVVSGAGALAVAAALAAGVAPRWLVPAWNVVGAALLLNVLTVAAVSTPAFAWFGPDRLNTWVVFPPFVWLPAVMVPAAALGHLLVWRKLRDAAAGGGVPASLRRPAPPAGD
jgi:hypothetical protein